MLIAFIEANKEERKIIMAKEIKKIDSVKKLESNGVKLTQKEKKLLIKADNLQQKILEGKIDKEKGEEEIREIFKKLTTNERY
ncbi:MAG: hypothetical protein II567_00045 [Candidatus Riflebacteria bacterium]|nr:hypothetical protein [Candidatus Riflebacteria bacterium]